MPQHMLQASPLLPTIVDRFDRFVAGDGRVDCSRSINANLVTSGE
jgi:hypothetical protein